MIDGFRPIFHFHPHAPGTGFVALNATIKKLLPQSCGLHRLPTRYSLPFQFRFCAGVEVPTPLRAQPGIRARPFTMFCQLA